MNVIRDFKEREIAKVIDPSGCFCSSGAGAQFEPLLEYKAVVAFAPLLKRKRAHIKQIPVKTFRYTSGDRGELDVYYPLTPQPGTPVLFFIYGGGFNTGERSISPKTFGLVYANVAAYFARSGYIVVIPDYRLVPHVEFPGSAEDVREALRWVVENKACLVSDTSPHPNVDDIVMLGHSAGAAHIATMLFLTDVLPKDDSLRDRIKAIVLISPPYDLSAMTMEWPTAEVHAKYWVTLDNAKQNDPWHLFQRLDDEVVAKLPRILMVEGEFEPEWLINAGKVFSKVVKERTEEDLRVVIAKGHNHISMNWALSTGEGEEWAEEVLAWLDTEKITSGVDQ